MEQMRLLIAPTVQVDVCALSEWIHLGILDVDLDKTKIAMVVKGDVTQG